MSRVGKRSTTTVQERQTPKAASDAQRFTSWLVRRLEEAGAGNVGVDYVLDDRGAPILEYGSTVTVDKGAWHFSIFFMLFTDGGASFTVWVDYRRPRGFKDGRSWLNALELSNDMNIARFAEDAGAITINKEGLIGTAIVCDCGERKQAPAVIISSMQQLRDTLRRFNRSCALLERRRKRTR